MGGPSGPAEALRARLRLDLRIAMKTRNAAEIGLLRGLIAAIDNAEAVAVNADTSPRLGAAAGGSTWVATGGAFGSADVPRRVLNASDLEALLHTEAGKRASTALEMDRCGRTDEAERARAEIRMVMRYVRPS